MRALLLAAGCLAACGPAEEPPPPIEAGLPVATAPEAALASRPVPGVEIWFMEGRPAHDSTGFECVERTLEIRDSTGTRRVPLLYTLDAPTRLDDSSVRAQVFLHCQPGQAYRINLRTGLPTPLSP